MVDLFCGGGGSSEGIRRAGITVCGIDADAQPDYVSHFGADSFTQADALQPDAVLRAMAQVGAMGISASPPCKAYATTTIADGQVPSAALACPHTG